MDFASFCAVSSTFNLNGVTHQLRALSQDELNELGARYPAECAKLLGLSLTLGRDPSEFVCNLLGLPFLHATLYQSRLLAAVVAVSINDETKRNEIMALPDLTLLLAFGTVLALTLVESGACKPTGEIFSLADLAAVDFTNALVN